MLTRMRQGLSSWPAKIFLGVIALSFVGWGVGDIFAGRGDTVVADVDATEIDLRDLRIAYRDRLRQLQDSGVHVEPGSDLAHSLARAALDRLVLDALRTQAADGMGVAVGEKTLAQDIRDNALFADASGSFSASRFAGVLATNGLTEERYLEILGDGLRMGQFVNGVAAAPPPPSTLVDAIFRHRHERRAAMLAVVPNEALAPWPVPEAGELESYFEARLSDYGAPEYRSARYLLVYPQDLARNMQVSEDEVLAAYRASPGAWTDPERRRLQQIPFDTKEAADRAFASIAEGADFARVASEEAGVDAGQLDFGWVEPDDLFPELAEPVFAGEPGTALPPIASPLGGWLIFRIAEIEPGRTTTFEEARPAVESDLKLQRARDAIYDLAFDMDDLVAAGATVAETAEALDLESATIGRIAENGTFEDPSPSQTLPAAREFLEEVFRGESGVPSPVIETRDGGLLIVEVEEIVEARLRDFAEARDDALEDWLGEERARLAHEAARALVDAAGSAGDLDAAFSETGAAFVRIEPLRRTRTPDVPNVGPNVVSVLFEIQPGETAVVPSFDGRAQVVARLLDIVAGDPLADAEDLAAVAASLESGSVADIVDRDASALRDDAVIGVDGTMIERHF